MRLRYVPILGPFLIYLNLYSAKGHVGYLRKRAPAYLMLERVVIELLINAAIVFLIFLFAEERMAGLDLAGVVLGSFPSLLGFGIGVFALIFVLPDDFLQRLDKSSEKTGLGSTMLVSDIAFPLVYLAFGLAASVVISIISSALWGQYIQLLIFLYGITLTCDLISVIAVAALALRHGRAREARKSKVLRGLRRSAERTRW